MELASEDPTSVAMLGVIGQIVLLVCISAVQPFFCLVIARAGHCILLVLQEDPELLVLPHRVLHAHTQGTTSMSCHGITSHHKTGHQATRRAAVMLLRYCPQRTRVSAHSEITAKAATSSGPNPIPVSSSGLTMA